MGRRKKCKATTNLDKSRATDTSWSQVVMRSIDCYEIHMELVHAISSFCHLWLTVTFATIVAFHIGRESVTKVLLAIGS